MAGGDGSALRQAPRRPHLPGEDYSPRARGQSSGKRPPRGRGRPPHGGRGARGAHPGIWSTSAAAAPVPSRRDGSGAVLRPFDCARCRTPQARSGRHELVEWRGLSAQNAPRRANRRPPRRPSPPSTQREADLGDDPRACAAPGACTETAEGDGREPFARQLSLHPPRALCGPCVFPGCREAAWSRGASARFDLHTATARRGRMPQEGRSLRPLRLA